jgi:hypothetical protein
MHVYIKGLDIYYKEFEGSDERYLRRLTEAIHADARETVECWESEFGDEALDYANTDWLDVAFNPSLYDEDDEAECEASEQGIDKELFIKVFERSVKVIR